MSETVHWIDTGNGESSALVEDAENAGNYRSLRVWPNQAGGYSYEVNGFFRGWEPNKRSAQREAILFARAQIAGDDEAPLPARSQEAEESAQTEEPTQ